MRELYVVLFLTTINGREAVVCEKNNDDSRQYIAYIPHEFIEEGYVIEDYGVYPIDILSEDTKQQLRQELAEFSPEELAAIRADWGVIPNG